MGLMGTGPGVHGHLGPNQTAAPLVIPAIFETSGHCSQRSGSEMCFSSTELIWSLSVCITDIDKGGLAYGDTGDFPGGPMGQWAGGPRPQHEREGAGRIRLWQSRLSITLLERGTVMDV